MVVDPHSLTSIDIWGARYKKNLSEPNAELRPQLRKGCNKPFTKKYFFSKFLILSTGQPRRRRPAKIAARWRYEQHYRFLSASIFVLIRKTADLVQGTAYVAGPNTNTVLNKQMKYDFSYKSCLVIGLSQSLAAYMIWLGSL